MRAGDLIGNYRLERDIGAGSFATVWLARDEVLEAPVAIKVLADNWARNPDIRRRFLDEARIMRRIDHDRVVRVFAVEQLANGQPLFVMAHADRGTLADRVPALAAGRSLDAVVETMTELATCLAVVHSMGIVHRDLKPTNVLYRSRRPHEDGVGDLMQLGDFGLAKDLVAASGLTLAAGTPAYMAPEQARTGSVVDQRADLYAATAILFELLVGRPPSDAETLSGVGQGAAHPGRVLAVTRADLPPGLAGVLDTGLQRDPADRFPDVHTLLAALSAAAGGTPATVPVLPEALGITAAVASLVRRAAGTDPVLARVADRLDGPLHVAVTADATAPVDLPEGVTLAGHGDPVDIVVTAPGARPSSWRDAVGAGLAGPVAVAADDVAAVVARVLARRAHVVASAVLADLEAAVRASRDTDVAGRWARCVDDVDRLRYDVPELDELAALRELVSGRALVPASMRADAERVLLDGDGGDVSTRLATWREYQGSGRVGFAARGAVDTVVRALERRWSPQA